MPLFIRQVWTLYRKNLLIAAVRRPISTIVRAVILPLTIVLVVAYSQYFFNPTQRFGMGSPSTVLSLSDALSHASASRDTVVFVNSGFIGGDISRVIDEVSEPFRQAGKRVITINSQSEVSNVCLSSDRGSSNCFAAAMFVSSATEPSPESVWNYTLRADSTLGKTVNVESPHNDAQIYLQPFQAAIDTAILRRTPNSNINALSGVQQFEYTMHEQQEHGYQDRSKFLNRCVRIFSIVFILAMIGIVYQLTGLMASEREQGLTQLLEAMMSKSVSWQPQAARLLAYHLAFTTIYGPSWLAVGIVIATVVFRYTSAVMMVFYHLTLGLALCSFSILGASFFNSSQVCSITITIITLVTAVIPQVLPKIKQTSATVTALSFLFPSSNYQYFLENALNFEIKDRPLKLSEAPPQSPWALDGRKMWCFLILQILLYPLLAAVLEDFFFGTTSKKPKFDHQPEDDTSTVQVPVQVRDFSKIYKQHWFLRLFIKRKQDVQAVTGLTLNAHKGQILMLLGPNGSGKSTTLDAIAGLSKPSGGSIKVDRTNGLGIAPQKNVLWDDLTVAEHVFILHRLKAGSNRCLRSDLDALVGACDLKSKRNAKSKTLSGGQKRKLQLAMMFAGGSSTCCVDEVSSSLDPLSRRKIWDILLAERGDRTIIMTTHFLDEADFLSDNIVILSKGTLQAEGSSAALKQSLGDGYTVTVPLSSSPASKVVIPGVIGNEKTDQVVFSQLDSARTGYVVDHLERNGAKVFNITSPTLEDIFLKLTGASLQDHSNEEAPAKRSNEKTQLSGDDCSIKTELVLRRSNSVSAIKQWGYLLHKRFIVLRGSYMPYISAVVVSLIAAGICPLLLKHFEPMRCAIPNSTIEAQYYTNTGYMASLALSYEPSFVGGPPDQVSPGALERLVDIYSPDHTKYSYLGSYGGIQNISMLEAAISPVLTVPDFRKNIAINNYTLNPGAFWLGGGNSPPQFAWNFERGVPSSIEIQNVINILLTNITISVGYADFDVPPKPRLYDLRALMFIVYFVLVICIYPGFFAIYPTRERLQNVRALQYSNGVRSLPTWLAHLAFDSAFIVLISMLSTIILATGSHLWYHIAYLFPILVFYGLSSTLLGYIISMMAKSHLGALSFLVGGQAFMGLAYFGAYLGVQSNADVADLESLLNKVHFSIALVSPSANLLRALFVSLNQFLLNCGRDGDPGQITLYGGPIVYLILQSATLCCILFLMDSGYSLSYLFNRRKPQLQDSTEMVAMSPEVIEEIDRVEQADSGLRVSKLSKSFGKHQALNDITFGVRTGEIFALLGPNGAGKSKLP